MVKKDKYAVISLAGKQYLVSEKEEILVDKISGKEPQARVLLLVDGEKVKLGKPEVKGVSLKLKILAAEVRGKKLTIQTYKAKSRSRRKVGFRPRYTKVRVEKF